MPKQKLTDQFAHKVQPPPPKKQTVYIDTLQRGVALTLTVGYRGTRSLGVLLYVNGKPKIMKLGNFPQMTVAEAHELAMQAFEYPQKYAEKKGAGTFRAVVTEFMRRHVEAEGLRSHKEVERCFTKYCYPHWADLPFNEIRRKEVVTLLDQINDDNGPRMADMVLAHLSKLCRWYQARNEYYVSPIVPGLRRTKGGGRTRKLSDDEIRALWKEESTFGAACKLLLLTAQRKSKVAEMRWTDIEEGIWRIHTEKREKGNAGTIRLSNAALTLLAELPRIAGNPFVLPATNGRGYYRAFFNHRAALQEGEGAGWTIHDLRRTSRSLMSRAGVQPHIAERVLGHVMSGVEGIYDRHAYTNEISEALDKLAALIEVIVNPRTDNVVPLVSKVRGRKTG